MRMAFLFLTFLLVSNTQAQSTPEDCKVEMPKEFSATKEFNLQSTCLLYAFKLSMLNRWGSQVFEMKTLDNAAIARELKKLSTGVYYYIITYSPEGAQEKETTGHITVLN